MHARTVLGFVLVLTVSVVSGPAQAAYPQVNPTRAAPPPRTAPVFSAPQANNAPYDISPGSPLVPEVFDGPTSADGDYGSRFWVEANFLLAWLDSGHQPLLVVASPPGTPQSQAGFENVPGTKKLFGDYGSGENSRPGYQLRAGWTFDQASRQGFEVSLLSISRAGETFSTRSDGSPIIARPFFDAQTLQPAAEVIAYPGLLAGEIRVRTASDLVGTEVNYRCSLAHVLCWDDACGCGDGTRCSSGNWQVDFLTGYRSLRYRDKIEIKSNTRPLDPTNPATQRVGGLDSFYGKNMFNGVQVGLDSRFNYNGFYLDTRAMAALGQRKSRTDINGYTDILAPGATRVGRAPAGLLAGFSNIGVYRDQDTAFVGELDLRLGYRFNSHLNVSVGYTLLYFSSVIRSNEIVDRVVNQAALPPTGTMAVDPQRPGTVLQSNDIWAQGLTLGVEVRY